MRLGSQPVSQSRDQAKRMTTFKFLNKKNRCEVHVTAIAVITLDCCNGGGLALKVRKYKLWSCNSKNNHNSKIKLHMLPI